jgi:hypothetical protein
LSDRCQRKHWPQGTIHQRWPRSRAATESNAALYDGQVAERIQQAVYELGDLVRSCVAVDEKAMGDIERIGD